MLIMSYLQLKPIHQVFTYIDGKIIHIKPEDL